MEQTHHYRASSAFEIEAGTLEEFLHLLQEREAERERGTLHGVEPLPRTAVFVSQLLDQRGTKTGFPVVRRYVRTGFVYGEDLVSYEIPVSHDLELPNMPDSHKPREHHTAAFEETRDKIADWIDRHGLAAKRVFVLDGHLHHSSNPRAQEGS